MAVLWEFLSRLASFNCCRSIFLFPTDNCLVKRKKGTKCHEVITSALFQAPHEHIYQNSDVKCCFGASLSSILPGSWSLTAILDFYGGYRWLLVPRLPFPFPYSPLLVPLSSYPTLRSPFPVPPFSNIPCMSKNLKLNNIPNLFS